MTPPEILADLRSRGIRLWLEAGQPKLEPAHRMREDDWHALRTHRGSLVALLADELELVTHANGSCSAVRVCEREAALCDLGNWEIR